MEIVEKSTIGRSTRNIDHEDAQTDHREHQRSDNPVKDNRNFAVTSGSLHVYRLLVFEQQMLGASLTPDNPR